MAENLETSKAEKTPRRRRGKTNFERPTGYRIKKTQKGKEKG